MPKWRPFCPGGDKLIIVTQQCFGSNILIQYRLLVDSPHKGPITQALMFSLMIAWTKCWTNSPVTSDLRHQDSHVASLECHLLGGRIKIVYFSAFITLFSLNFVSEHYHLCPYVFQSSQISDMAFCPVNLTSDDHNTCIGHLLMHINW